MVSSSAAAPFKGLCLGRVFLRMAGPRLLPREAEALQQTPQRGGVEGLAKAGFADAHKVRHEPLLGIMRVGNHGSAKGEIAAAQQESVFSCGGITTIFSGMSKRK